MTDQQKIDKLRAALAGLLRQTAQVSPISAIHPAFINARAVAARAYQETDAPQSERQLKQDAGETLAHNQ
jgi:hypothetical protein